jgi:hypothetical protein
MTRVSFGVPVTLWVNVEMVLDPCTEEDALEFAQAALDEGYILEVDGNKSSVWVEDCLFVPGEVVIQDHFEDAVGDHIEGYIQVYNALPEEE